MLETKPDAIVHQATALANGIDLKRYAETFAPTNRLQAEGTDNLIGRSRCRRRAVHRAELRRLDLCARERALRDRGRFAPGDPPAQLRRTYEATRHLERTVLGIDGIVLRYAGFYGPGTSLDRDGEQTEAVRKRRFPLVGEGRGAWSFIHVDDAATATLAAIEHGQPGIYNVVDDDPAPVREWLPYLAEVAGAKPPRRVPAWLAKRFVDEHGVAMMTRTRGSSNAKGQARARVAATVPVVARRRPRGAPAASARVREPPSTSDVRAQSGERRLSHAAPLSRLRGNQTEGAIMKILVAGATGALGRELVPRLVAGGHEVVGMTRSASKQNLVRSLGARPVVADALDPDAVAQAVASAEPEVIVHQLTALSVKMSLRDARHPERSSGAIMTNRLRTEATDHLSAAGRAVGARRFVAQSFGAFRFAGAGGPVQTEADAVDPDPRQTGLEAILYLERAVSTIEWGEGLVLRYGGFYGPGTGISLAPDAVMAGPIRKRRFPIIGDGGGIWSLIHIEDAAAATAVAVERGRPGVYNVVDDEPAPVREWLPVLASALDAKPPRRIPRWLGRLAGGEMATLMMTEARGASNEKAKRELGWELRYPSWRHGFAQGLG